MALGALDPGPGVAGVIEGYGLHRRRSLGRAGTERDDAEAGKQEAELPVDCPRARDGWTGMHDPTLREGCAAQRVRALYEGSHGALWERIERERAESYFETNAVLARRRAHAMLFEWTGDVAGRHVLDVGCGLGTLAAALAARGARVLGLDLVPRFVEIAARRVGDARFACADAMSWPGGAACDIALLSEVLEDYPPQGRRALIASLCARGAPRVFLLMRIPPPAPWRWLPGLPPAVDERVELLRWIHTHVPYRIYRQTSVTVRHYRVQLLELRYEDGTGSSQPES